MPTTQTIESLTQSFVQQLVALIEGQATQRMQAQIAAVLGMPVKRGPGRPPKNAFIPSLAPSSRKKPPKQFCPVPGCKNVAAPVFGMVCSAHKDVPKAKIKQYRAARKAAKAKK